MAPFWYLAVAGLILAAAGCIPRSGPSLLEKAREVSAREPAEARRLYGEIIRTSPGTEIAVEASYRLGLLHLQSGKTDAALEQFREATATSLASVYKTAAHIELLGIEESDRPETIDRLWELTDELKQSTGPVKPAIQRGLFYIAKTACNTQDWNTVLTAADACDTRFLDSEMTIKLEFYRGTSLGRINQNRKSIQVLTSILGPDNPLNIETLSELI